VPLNSLVVSDSRSKVSIQRRRTTAARLSNSDQCAQVVRPGVQHGSFFAIILIRIIVLTSHGLPRVVENAPDLKITRACEPSNFGANGLPKRL